MISIDVPNLDSATAEELEEFSKHCSRLATYAEFKAMAMKFRAVGEIIKAQRYETRCRMIYELLPPEWRW